MRWNSMHLLTIHLRRDSALARTLEPPLAGRFSIIYQDET